MDIYVLINDNADAATFDADGLVRSANKWRKGNNYTHADDVVKDIYNGVYPWLSITKTTLNADI